jgi:hypothetical protein
MHVQGYSGACVIAKHFNGLIVTAVFKYNHSTPSVLFRKPKNRF